MDKESKRREKTERKILTNGTILTPLRKMEKGTIRVEGGEIQHISQSMPEELEEDGCEKIDLKGNYVVPGFIDIHLHGGGGADLMDGTVDALRTITRTHAAHGTTALLPTTTTAPWEEIEQALDVIRELSREERLSGGGKVLGAHVEGPYFSGEQAGAQNPDYLTQPGSERKRYLKFLKEYGDSILRFSAAPELPGGLELGRKLRERGILVSIGHSDATYEEVLEAIEAGYTHSTHMFSGMSGLERKEGYRISGLIESTLLLDELTTEIIADGHHLPPSLIRLTLKAKGAEKLALVTDSMRAAGLGAGDYEIGGLDVIVEDRVSEEFELPREEGNYVAKLPDRTAFAGSVATMDQLIRTMVGKVGLSLEETLKMATYNPARIMGVEDEYGLLRKGRAADMVIMNEELEVKDVLVDGKFLEKGIG